MEKRARPPRVDSHAKRICFAGISSPNNAMATMIASKPNVCQPVHFDFSDITHLPVGFVMCGAFAHAHAVNLNPKNVLIDVAYTVLSKLSPTNFR